jgi:hypothetical protein
MNKIFNEMKINVQSCPVFVDSVSAVHRGPKKKMEN